MEDSSVLFIPYVSPQGSIDDIDIRLTDQIRVAEFSVSYYLVNHLYRKTDRVFNWNPLGDCGSGNPSEQ